MAQLADIYWNDGRLVKQVLAEDPRAFERLIARHQRRACAIARATGIRAADLEDVVQESFVRAFEKLGQLRSPSRFRPWFLEIVRNVARSTLRRDARREAAMSPSTEAHRAGTASCADHMEQREMREALWREVSRLPESVREAIFLYYYEGRSVTEVARSLSITRGAVLKRLQRGREMLRERLWLELRDAVTEMLPSARASRLAARRLALLVLGTTSLANAARAAAAPSAGATAARSTLNGPSVDTYVDVGFSKRRFVQAYLVLEGVVDPSSSEVTQPLQHGRETFSFDRLPPGKFSARLREQVVRPEREKAFYGGESINIREDTFDRETLLGEVEIRAGRTAELEVALPDVE